VQVWPFFNRIPRILIDFLIFQLYTTYCMVFSYPVGALVIVVGVSFFHPPYPLYKIIYAFL
jgi:hypothetical protein